MKTLKIISVAAALVLCCGLLSSCLGETVGPRPETLRDEGYHPPITLTLAEPYYAQYTALFNEKGWTLSDNKMMDLYRNELGVKFEHTIDVNDAGIYFTKLNASILSGILPDITCMGDAYFGIPNLRTANDNGLLADLTPYIKGTAEDKASDAVLNIWEIAGDEIFTPGTFDGKIKTLPWTADSRGDCDTFLYFRKDWLDAVGKQTPTSVDELTDVMRAFTTMKDDNSTYGLVIANDVLNGGGRFVFNMFGLHPCYWLENDDGELYYGATDAEPMKAALGLLRAWYAEGLINHEEDNDISVIGSLHYACQQFTNGRAGVYPGKSSMGFVSDTVKRNPDAEIIAVPLFAADGYELEFSSGSNAVFFYTVSSSCQYPEVGIKLYNFQTEIAGDDDYIEYFLPTVYENSAGETVNDYPPAQFAPIRINLATDLDYQRQLLENIQLGMTEGMTDRELDTYENYRDALENTTNKNYWTVQQYKEGGVLEDYYDLLENGTFVGNCYTVANTESMDKYKNDLDASLILGALDIIKGVQPVDYWDTVIDAWLEGGGTEMTAEANAWWDGIKA